MCGVTLIGVQLYSISANGQLQVWQCDTALDGLIPSDPEEQEENEQEDEQEEDKDKTEENGNPYWPAFIKLY